MAVEGFFVVYNGETKRLEVREWPFLDNPHLKLMRDEGHASPEDAQKELEEIQANLERIQKRWNKPWFWHMPRPAK